MENERRIQELTSALKTLKLHEAELTAQLKEALESKDKQKRQEVGIWIKNKLHKPATWINKFEWNKKEGKTATVTEDIVRGPGEQVHFLTDSGVLPLRTQAGPVPAPPQRLHEPDKEQGRGGRNRTGASSGRGQQGRTSHRPTLTNFKGDTEGMNANVFECFEEQTDRRQFTKTLEAPEAYIKKILKFAEDMTALFADEMEEPRLELPTELDPGASTVENAIWDEELREFVKRKGAFKGNLATIQVVVLGQCSESMKKSSGHWKPSNWRQKEQLLQQIRSITLQFDEKKNGFISIMNAQRSFLNCKQHPGQSPASYLTTSVRGQSRSPNKAAASLPTTGSSPPKIKTAGTSPKKIDRTGLTTRRLPLLS
ncbi:hypothetical protein MHU86_9292 [Fragilaria crotonensis]|nr:hypothetical protein MHU86_9292 [Fragilaria crotonensis]